jgi:predicted HD phosphohydrolase
MQLPSRAQPPTERAAALVQLMEENAQGDYIGESISQLEHSLQCAHLAAKAGKR